MCIRDRYKRRLAVSETADMITRCSIVKRDKDAKTILVFSNIADISSNVRRVNTSHAMSGHRRIAKSSFRVNTALNSTLRRQMKSKSIASSYRVDSSGDAPKHHASISFNIRIFSNIPTANFSLQGSHIHIHPRKRNKIL
eukprot:TRINITY_DN17670_c0_g1_i1.p3 TRINITY_DN17670_c0_g1~~TRINITY_DN17670_c0_g1_i1.p3  ORF type:complete len:140 (-),score=4.31 TRINITY_DN17670_c0_g1_i1:96-515(-)